MSAQVHLFIHQLTSWGVGDRVESYHLSLSIFPPAALQTSVCDTNHHQLSHDASLLTSLLEPIIST